mgnify:CR=1 FL=1
MLKAPFPWFGGKSRVSPEVWEALGDVSNYVEPFAGSLAVLLGRPTNHTETTETVNDADGFIVNFWRALKHDPNGVAEYAGDPVNETDLIAKHLWLVNTGRTRLLEGLESDPEWYDPKVAGWWVWGLCSWIGRGWCAGTGPWMHGANGDTVEKRPHLGNAEQGVWRQLPHLGDAGQGVNRQRPHLGNAEQGVWRQDEPLHAYMSELADRLRNVRVCSGDWARVVTTGALSYPRQGPIGVFLDPPYLGEIRKADLYSVDDHHISHEVRDWCLTNGDDPRLRIVLAGYTTEHDHLMPDTWRRHYWKASAAYQTAASAKTDGGNMGNRETECLWLSPHCLNPADHNQTQLFDTWKANK